MMMKGYTASLSSFDMISTLDSGRPPVLPQSILSPEALKRLGSEFIHLGDEMEKHGLIDSQMAGWKGS